MHSSNKVHHLYFSFKFRFLVFLDVLQVYLILLVQIKSLATFQDDATCLALIMDGSTALGLDLSFVTHVFLMEPIWDRRYYVLIIDPCNLFI